jgi:hypothetical protein
MPVHNGAVFLDRAVRSILDQSFRDLEFVIVDDGSTDDTPGMLAKYARSDGRVRVWTQDMQGLAASLHTGCADARGEFIARMDADDVATPDRLEKQLAELERRPALGVVGGAMELIDTRDARTGEMRFPLRNDSLQRAFLSGNNIAHPTACMRREACLEVGNYRHCFRHAEEYDLWLRIAERWEIANLPEVVLRYRIHGTQVTATDRGPRLWHSAAACASAAMRRWTGADPMAGVDCITPELLLKLCAKVVAAKARLVARLRKGAKGDAPPDHVGPGRAPAGLTQLAEGLMRWYVKAAAFEASHGDVDLAEALARSAREIARSARVSAKSLSKLYREAARVRWSQSRPLDAALAAQQALIAALVRPARG